MSDLSARYFPTTEPAASPRHAFAILADENAALLRTNSNLRAALLAAALAVENRTDVPPSTVQAWRETAS